MHTHHVAYALTRAGLYLESHLQVKGSQSTQSTVISKLLEEVLVKKSIRKYLGTIQIAAAGALTLALSACGPMGEGNARNDISHPTTSTNSFTSTNTVSHVSGAGAPHGLYFSYPVSTSTSETTSVVTTESTESTSEGESASHGGFGGFGGGHGGEGAGE